MTPFAWIVFVAAFVTAPIASADVAASCKKSNGCGPQNAPGLVRDTWGTIDFRKACDGHDACYATQGRSKESCDTAFLADMLSACRATFTEDGISRRSCYGLASDYYGAVWLVAVGAYDDAQACLKDKLAGAEAGIRSLIIELRSRSKHRRDSGVNADAAAALAKQKPAILRTTIDDDMTALRANTNEIALYKTMLANATPANATPTKIAVHRIKVTKVQEVVDELKVLHDTARAAVDREFAKFSRASYEAHVTYEASAQATTRFNEIDAKLDEASDALARARSSNVGIGQHAPPDQAGLANAARLAHQADTMLDAVVTYLHRGIVAALASDLRPLRDAQEISVKALRDAWPMYARGRVLVGKPLFTMTIDNRPPPPR